MEANSSIDSNKSEGSITSQLSKIDFDEEFELIVSIDTSSGSLERKDCSKTPRETPKNIIPTQTSAKSRSSVSRRPSRMKDKKMISEYEIVKEILDENPEFLEKYLKDKISEKEVQNLVNSLRSNHSLSKVELNPSHDSFELLKVDLEKEKDDIEGEFFEKVKIFLATEFGLENDSLKITIKDKSEDEGLKAQKGSFLFSFEMNEKSFAVLEIKPSKGSKLPQSFQTNILKTLRWIQTILYFVEGNRKLMEKDHSKNFLLKIAQSIFQEMVSMDTLILQIMNQAQKLVNADRASLFLVDSRNDQLYARIFDVSQDVENQEVSETFKEIRFPLSQGIAGYVATTGETMNVRDVSEDQRFNANIDQKTGYLTKSILCMPIKIQGCIIGVMQMVNKIDGYFTSQDEEAFQTFSIFCGLALHHAKLYDKIRRSEQKLKVSQEVLSYHNTATPEEVDMVQDLNSSSSQIDVDQLAMFSYYGPELDDMIKVERVLVMFNDLFGCDKFDCKALIRFITTVKKNYRDVAYHNWTHGFHVANSAFAMLKSCGNTFRPLEKLSMFIGALCHDLDHRGFNNKFMIDIGSPLAAIYSTSTMEHHHFNMTIIILQHEPNNIFKKLSSEEYKQVLGNMKHCILATDLALFFPNRAKLSQLQTDHMFDLTNTEHRLLLQTMVMTGSDLCASSKPWDQQLKTVSVIYEEFYVQGDYERQSGRLPVPIMNRYLEDEQAIHQVGFLSGICIPCYSLLSSVLPTVTPMLDQCRDNLGVWRKLAEAKKKERDL